MITFTQFLYEFLAQFLTGIINIIKDIIITIPQMFNILEASGEIADTIGNGRLFAVLTSDRR